MMRVISAFALLTAATLGITACGDDDDDSGKGGGAGTSNNSAAGEPGTDPGPDAGGTTGSPSENVPCEPSNDTTCQNDKDCPFVVDGSARTTAQTCGKEECLGKEASCAANCIVAQLDMSNECAACYGAFVNCTIKQCLSECVVDPDSDECHQCQVDSGCRSTFDACSGLEE